MEATIQAARDAWERASGAITSGDYDLVILDEATYPVTFDWLDADAVVEVLENRPEHVNVIITGRDADQRLIDIADTVTEMRKVKHAFDAGIVARKGLDY
jgi:cob(I)alamin adenosyltransferase